MARLVGLLLAIGSLAALAGCANTSCTNNSGGQACEGKGSLVYNGAANGGQDASVSCDTTVRFQMSSSIGGGQVAFTVKDGSGVQQYTKTAAQGQTTDNKDLEGKSGTWTLHAERTGGLLQPFSGSYEATLTC